MTTREISVYPPFAPLFANRVFRKACSQTEQTTDDNTAEKTKQVLSSLPKTIKELVNRLYKSSRLGAKIFVQLVVEFLQTRIENILFRACSQSECFYWLAF